MIRTVSIMDRLSTSEFGFEGTLDHFLPFFLFGHGLDIGSLMELKLC